MKIMRSIVAYGPKDLRLVEQSVDAPGPGQVAIRTATGGICGSDLHYFNHGGFGTVRLKEPMVLGHEVSGFISQLGDGVEGLSVGDLVAISPSRPCGECKFCLAGQQNHCLNMRFYGSAMPFPHIQGAFREMLVVDASQCVKADGLTASEAAMAEPLSVGLHATRRAGEMLGKKVLITGCGPIGALVIQAARMAGATEIVVCDLVDEALACALNVGADRVINIGENPDALNEYDKDKGYFDVLFECSGAARALANAVPALRPRGVILQLGLGGDMTLPVQAMTAKELDMRGSFRFHEEFAVAVRAMQRGLVNVKPVITSSFSIDEAETAFTVASDRKQAMKTQIVFSEAS